MLQLPQKERDQLVEDGFDSMETLGTLTRDDFLHMGLHSLVEERIHEGKEFAIHVYKTCVSKQRNKLFRLGGKTLNWEQMYADWQNFQHPSIAKCLGVSPFYEKSLLFERGETSIDKLTELLPVSTRLKVALNIAEAVEYLHTRDTPRVHGCINGTHVILRADKSAFLTGLFSDHLDPIYMAPEAFSYGVPLCLSTDVWSVGMLLYVLWMGNPYEGKSDEEVIAEVGNRRKTSLANLRRDCAILSNLIDSCWELNPESRCSIHNVVYVMKD